MGGDTLTTGDHPSEDTLTGGSGNDTIGGEDHHGDLGGMTITGTDGADILMGGYGNDSLFSGAGNDVIQAGEGADTIDGGSGDDTIIAHGPDVPTSGDGNDLLLIHSKAGASEDSLAHITDFTSGQDHLMFQDEDMHRGLADGAFGTGTATDYASACLFLLDGSTVDDAEVLGVRSAVEVEHAFVGEAAAQKFAHRRRPARHPPGEAPVVEGAQFLGREHDLQAFLAVDRHPGPPDDASVASSPAQE